MMDLRGESTDRCLELPILDACQAVLAVIFFLLAWAITIGLVVLQDNCANEEIIIVEAMPNKTSAGNITSVKNVTR